MSLLPARPVVLITGCSEGGIGDFLARAFAARGCRVVATARKVASMGPLQALGCDLMPLDVTDPAACQATVEAVVSKYGGLHILVNNAGVPGASGERAGPAVGAGSAMPCPHDCSWRHAWQRPAPALASASHHAPGAPRSGSLAEVPLSEYEATMDVNVTAPLRMIQLVGSQPTIQLPGTCLERNSPPLPPARARLHAAALPLPTPPSQVTPHMARQGGGIIVNNSSAGAYILTPYIGAGGVGGHAARTGSHPPANRLGGWSLAASRGGGALAGLC